MLPIAYKNFAIFPNLDGAIVAAGSNEFAIARIATSGGQSAFAGRILRLDHFFLGVDAFGDHFVVFSVPNAQGAKLSHFF